MEFKKTWLTIEEIVNIITYSKDIENFLLDIQNDYRIQRAMAEDENDRLLTGTRIIDDIINRLWQLETARREYFEKLKEEENKKLQEQINN